MHHPTVGGRAVAAEPAGEARATVPPPHHTLRRQRDRAGLTARGLRRGRRASLFATLAALLAALALGLAACGDASGSMAEGETAEQRELMVFAAASLTQVFTRFGEDLAAGRPGLEVTFNFAGSNDLVTQLQQGAPADVLATADTGTMAKAGDLVIEPQAFAGNTLVIAVAPGNPKGITGLAGLSRKDVKVVLAAPEVPAGKYAGEALSRAGVQVDPVSLEVTVKGVLTKVALGEADAGIVYVTDVAAAKGDVDGVAIPGDENVIATYPIATVAASVRPDDAQAFLDLVLSPQGQKVLAEAGFLPAR